MPARPTSVTVLAIIGIVWACFNLLGTCTSPAMMALQWNTPTMQVYHDPLILIVFCILMLLTLGIGILLLASSIASLKLKPWARKGMIAYGALYILISLISTVFNLIFVMPKLNAAMVAAAPAGGPDMRFIIMVTQIGTICFMVVTFIHPVAIFYYYTRPRVINAFNGIFDAPAGNFPVGTPSP